MTMHTPCAHDEDFFGFLLIWADTPSFHCFNTWSLFRNILGEDLSTFCSQSFSHSIQPRANPARLQTSVLSCVCVFFSMQPHFLPGPLSCPGSYPPSVQPPHRAADATISPQISPANWDRHRHTWVQSGGSGVLEPAKQSWFDRFPLNPDETHTHKKKCTPAC